MRLLLDTHVALWTVYQSEKLSSAAHSMLAEAQVEAYFSVASLWEIAIKRAKYPEQLLTTEEARKNFLDAGLMAAAQ